MYTLEPESSFIPQQQTLEPQNGSNCADELHPRADSLQANCTKASQNTSIECKAENARSKQAYRQRRQHGLSHTREYRTWSDMLRRCLKKSHRDYDDYGGRGILVCARWRESFLKFLADMGPRPSNKHSLDRYPDNNGNYEPGNCRWASGSQQKNNTRVNRLLSHNGETLTLTEWATKLNICPSTIRQRILAYGWTVERALSQPVDSSKNWRVAA